MELKHHDPFGIRCSDPTCKAPAKHAVWMNTVVRLRMCDSCFGELRGLVGTAKSNGDVTGQRLRRNKRRVMRRIWESNDLTREDGARVEVECFEALARQTCEDRADALRELE